MGQTQRDPRELPILIKSPWVLFLDPRYKSFPFNLLVFEIELMVHSVFGYYRRWLWTAMAVLALPVAAIPGQAQVTSTDTLPGTTDSLLPASISTQAGDLMPSAVELPAVTDTIEPEAIPEDSVLAQQAGGDAGSPPVTALEDPNAGLRIPPNLAEGVPIQQVFIYLRNPTGDAEQDEALRQHVASTFRIRAGGNFSPLFAEQALSEVRQLPFVAAAEYRLYESNLPGPVILALLVTLQPEPTEAAPEETLGAQQPSGILVSGSFEDFPTLYQSDRSLVRFILNGGIGVFSDTNPWFGNADDFVAGAYQPTGTITWGEAYLEPGLAGITQVGDEPFYIYGAGTYTLSTTVQPDIFRTDSRFFADIEQLYGGLLATEPNSSVSFNLSAGRQKFQLNQGFLFSQFAGSANALNRAASFSNARTAYEQTVLANLRWGDVRLQGFFLQPDELPVADSQTQYLGTSLSFNHQNLEAALTYIAVPQSNRAYVLPDGNSFSREGLQVINPRLRLSSLFGVPGLWAEGEYAYQFSHQQSMAAQGGYVWLGYTAEEVPWQPSISYRFAGFSGDDPNTTTYERFDPLQASGLTDWLQGINLGKVYNNSNSFSHRVTFKVRPISTASPMS